MLSMRSALGAMAVMSIAGVAAAQVANGFNMQYRNFNDFPNSTITVNGGVPNANPVAVPMGTLNFNEAHAPLAPGNFANRHFAWFSMDNGATAYGLQANQSFIVRTRLDMDTTMATGLGTGAGGALMEGGPFHFMGNGAGNPAGPADGGTWAITNTTIFIGGVGHPFRLVAEGNGSVTDPNDPRYPFWNGNNPLDIEYIYVSPTDSPSGLPAVMATFTDTVTGVSRTTGWFGMDGAFATTGFAEGTQIGFRMQGGRNPLIASVNNWNYSNNFFAAGIPTPGAAAVLGLGALVAGRRRR